MSRQDFASTINQLPTEVPPNVGQARRMFWQWWRQQSPTTQDRYATLGPLISVMLFLAAVIAACGFKPRGANGQYRIPFHTIYLGFAETSPLGVELRRNLRGLAQVRGTRAVLVGKAERRRGPSELPAACRRRPERPAPPDASAPAPQPVPRP